VSAVDRLRAAVVADLGAVARMTVFDAPPVRGAVPHAVVGEAMLTDWSGAAFTGREGRFAVTLTDEGEVPVRLRTLVAAVEDRLPEMARDLGQGWRIAALRLAGGRMRRERARWTATVEFQVRLYRAHA
jgi:hypothetical protein